MGWREGGTQNKGRGYAKRVAKEGRGSGALGEGVGRRRCSRGLERGRGRPARGGFPQRRALGEPSQWEAQDGGKQRPGAQGSGFMLCCLLFLGAGARRLGRAGRNPRSSKFGGEARRGGGSLAGVGCWGLGRGVGWHAVGGGCGCGKGVGGKTQKRHCTIITRYRKEGSGTIEGAKHVAKHSSGARPARGKRRRRLQRWCSMPPCRRGPIRSHKHGKCWWLVLQLLGL